MADKKIKTAAGKPPMGMLPLRALVGAARVFEYGAKKYAPGNFIEARLKDGAAARYISAAIRHLMATQVMAGDKFFLQLCDEESGLPHLDHAIASLIMLRTICWAEEELLEDPGGDE